MEISELVQSVDILDYVSQFADFEEKGGEFWSLSPLQPEKTPSFSIRRETQQFYDFSSGKGGNILTFIQCYFKCNFPKALDILKEYAGVTGDVAPRQKLTATSIAKKYKNTQKNAPKCAKSTVLPVNCMERYEAREDKLKVWENEGISREVLEKFQVRYDVMSDRLVYPIKNVDGDIINIHGRTLDPDFKLKKLRKYTYFYPMGVQSTIYGIADNMESIKEQKEIILFEGAKSVMQAASWGFGNCGAVLTSHLSPEQLKILIKLSCRVVFALDKEVDIREDQNIRKLKRFVKVEYVRDTEKLLGEKDSPVDKGEEVWRHLYGGRRKL